jgi:hypothetical protein
MYLQCERAHERTHALDRLPGRRIDVPLSLGLDFAILPLLLPSPQLHSSMSIPKIKPMGSLWLYMIVPSAECPKSLGQRSKMDRKARGHCASPKREGEKTADVLCSAWP